MHVNGQVGMPVPAADAIVVNGLSKTYQVPEREGGFGAAVRGFFHRKYRDVLAVQQVSFQIRPGEIVGFLGPNGAGKTTTLKMLSGLLHPTAGGARVLGFTPWERKNDYLRTMTLVMGQRNRLSWDIPAADSFLLNQAVYRISDADYKRTLDELDELLDLAPIIRKPVRNLSLGERMKCELAAGLLHRPKVLFLDEPTIGLDITAQVRIREFLREYNRRTGATILLTSHYMADVTALCERIIIIHHGQLKYDGAITDLARRIAPFKLIGVALLDGAEDDLSRYGTPIPNQNGDGKQLIQVQADQVAPIAARMLAELAVQDLTIEDPPIEDVIERAFHEQVNTMLRIYQRMWQVNWAEQWQYRANLLMYLLFWLVSPIVFLSVWTTVANSQGSVQGLTANDFSTYYLTLLIVDNLTTQITIHLLAYKIQDGTLAGELLKPVHPILTNTLMNNLAFKALMLMVLIPVWIGLCLLFQPDFSHVTPQSLLLAVPAIILGFGISFLFGAVITCVAFWTTRVFALNEFYDALFILFGGLFVPLQLLPPLIQQIAQYLPFQLRIYFPIELILGKLPPDVIARDFALQAAWFLIALALFYWVWSRGVKRFSAVGA